MNAKELKDQLKQSAEDTLPPWEDHYFEVHSKRYLATLSLLGPGRGEKLLDVGAFPGHITLFAHHLGYQVTGLTGRSESTTSLNQIINRLQNHHIPVSIADVEFESFPYPDETFDVVLCLEIIEHLHYNPFRLLREAFRVLKPKGRILLSTPNLARLENFYFLLKGRSIHSDLRRRFDEVFSPILSARHVREYTSSDLTLLLEGQNKEMYSFEDTQVHFSSFSDSNFAWLRLGSLLEHFWPRFRSTLLVKALRSGQMILIHPEDLGSVHGFYPVENQEADQEGIARMLTVPFRWSEKEAVISLPASRAPYQIFYFHCLLMVPESFPPAVWKVNLGKQPLTYFSLSPDRMFTQLRIVIPLSSAQGGWFRLHLSGPSWRPIDHRVPDDFEFSLNDPRELGLVMGWDGFLRRDCENNSSLLSIARSEARRMENFENFDKAIHWRRLHHGYDDRWSHLQTLYLLQADFKPKLTMGGEDWRQLGIGWYFLENWREGPIRWISGWAEAFLSAQAGFQCLSLKVFSGDLRLGSSVSGVLKVFFSQDRIFFRPITEESFNLRAGIWTDLEVKFSPMTTPGIIKLIIQTSQPRSPVHLITGSTDTRELGLVVKEIRVY